MKKYKYTILGTMALVGYLIVSTMSYNDEMCCRDDPYIRSIVKKG